MIEDEFGDDDIVTTTIIEVEFIRGQGTEPVEATIYRNGTAVLSDGSVIRVDPADFDVLKTVRWEDLE